MSLATVRRLSLLLLAFVLSVLVGACGSSEAPDQRAGNVPPAPEGAFPVTIEHKYGRTTLESQPSRVVTIGLTDQDAVLALGVKPVGAMDWFGERPYGSFPWSAPKWGGTQPKIVGERGEINMEQVASLRPDVIVAQYTDLTKEKYDTLSDIAPVVAQSGKYTDFAAPWRDMTLRIARALGFEAKAKELIAGVEDKIAAARKQHPEFEGQTVAVADTVSPGDYSVFAAKDPRTVLMTELGFTVPKKVADLTSDGNPVDFGTERLDLLEVDKLIWLTSDPAAPERIKSEPLYQKLNVAQSGRAVFLPYSEPAIGAGVTFATVLSIPYAIEQAVPRLAEEQ